MSSDELRSAALAVVSHWDLITDERDENVYPKAGRVQELKEEMDRRVERLREATETVT